MTRSTTLFTCLFFLVNVYIVPLASGQKASQNVEHLKAKYESVIEFENGITGDVVETFYFVRLQGKWGMVQGLKEIIPTEYDAIWPLQYPMLVLKKGQCAIAHCSGQIRTAFKYDSIYDDFSMSTVVALSNGRLGLLNNVTGQELTPFVYVSFAQQSFDGCRCAKKEGKWGVLNREGKSVSGFLYDNIRWYNLNQIVLQRNGKWGFFDCQKQKESTPFIYEKVESHYSNEADVVLNGLKKRIKLE
jgi:hypothetical protein